MTKRRTVLKVTRQNRIRLRRSVEVFINFLLSLRAFEKFGLTHQHPHLEEEDTFGGSVNGKRIE